MAEVPKVAPIVKKQIKSLKKEVKKAKKVSPQVKTQLKSLSKKTQKALTSDQKQKVELEKLKTDIESLKKKGAKKKQLSEYNLFVSRQLKQGRTFAQAVRLWKRQQKATKKLRKTSKARPKIVKPKSVSLKTKKPKKTLKKKTKPKVVKKKVKKKAAAKVKTRVVKKTILSPKLEEALSLLKQSQKENEQIKSRLQDLFVRLRETPRIQTTESSSANTSLFFKELLNSMDAGSQTSEEEMAVKLAHLYFKEVARMGFKRSLELDSVINAYFYALARIKRSGLESKEIIDSVRKEGLSSKGF